MQTEPSRGHRYLRGKEPRWALGEEMLILALILKGPLPSIALSFLQKGEINMLLKAKRGCMRCGVFQDTLTPSGVDDKRKMNGAMLFLIQTISNT